MRRHFLLICFLIIACASPLAWGNLAEREGLTVRIGKIKTKTSKEIESSKFGVGFECLDRKMFDPSLYYDIAASLGVKHARCQTGWNITELEKGKYDFEWLDKVVDNLLARGIQPWFNVGYGNKLYMSPLENRAAVGHVPLFYGDECLQAWKNYVRALAEHFKGRVFEYEIWNEPNIKTFWRGQERDAKKYVELIELSAKEIKSVNPNAKIGAAIAGCGGKYFREMFENGAGNTLDFISFHPYSIMPELNYTHSIRSAKAYLKKLGVKTAIRQGEAGFPYNIPETCWVAKNAWHKGNESIQAKWMLRQFLLDFNSGVDLSSYFMITDFTSKYNLGKKAQVDTFAWGMTENGGECRQRQVCQAMRVFLTVFDKAKPADFNVAVNLRNPPKARISRLDEFAIDSASRAFTRNGKPMFVCYIPEDLQLERSAMSNVGVRGVGVSNEKALMVDLLTGDVYKPAKGLSSVTITDYPIVFCEEDTIADILVKDSK